MSKFISSIITFMVSEDMSPIMADFIEKSEEVAHRYHLEPTAVLETAIETIQDFIAWSKESGADGTQE